MSRRQKWKPRGARYLKTEDAVALLAACPVAREMHGSLTAQGYRLNPTMRPYLHGNGQTVTLRFVWRHRAADESVTIRFNQRVTVTVEREGA